MRDAVLAPGVPSEFFWAPEKLNGANQRFILAKADLFFQLLADALIYRWIKRQVFRFLSWRIENGLLRKPADPRWFEKMTFQTPRRITVDNGRDVKAELEQLAAGATTLRDIYDARGLNYRWQMRQWIREVLEFIKIAEEEGAPPAVIEKWKASVPLWRAHATGAGLGDPEKPAPGTEDDEEEADKARAA
jgi:hypothetical protein